MYEHLHCSVQFENINKLKGEFANFFIGLSDAPKYDIIWTENENLIEGQYLWN